VCRGEPGLESGPGSVEALARIALRGAWPGESEFPMGAGGGERSGPPGAGPLPSWVGGLAAWAERGRGRAGVDSAPCARTEEPLPFQDILLPLVEIAGERLASRPELPSGAFAPSAHADLERGLLLWLCQLCGPALLHEFSLYRLTRQSALDRIGSRAGGRALYESFARDVLCGDLLLLLGEYGALARLATVVVDRWTDMAAELGRRAAADRELLGRAFTRGRDPGRVSAVRWLSMDRHEGGRVILAVRFESGLHLVYKPRPVALEQRFSELVGWLDRRGRLRPRLRVARVVPRGGYGWMEVIRHAPCRDIAAAERFYRRAGSLLALVHALGGVDFHMENLIAHGEHPVLVDMESIMYPRALPAAVSSPEPSDGNPPVGLTDSVLATDLLPREHDARPFACSGLAGGTEFGSGSVERRKWDAVNTDDMALRLGPATVRRPENLPSLGGERLDPSQFREEIVEGFSSTYGMLVETRESLLAPDGAWLRFAGLPVRFVPRPTHVYGWIERRAGRPECLLSGADRDAELDVLERSSASWDPRRRSHFERLVASERRALREWDIPCFRTLTDSRDLPLPGDGLLKDFFEQSGYERATRRLQRMDEADLEVQVGHIVRALQGRTPIGRPSAHQSISASP